MQARIEYAKAAPGAVKAMRALESYQLARQHFGEAELVNLTLAIVAINGWNRLAIAFRAVPGTYQPRQTKP
jgi:alkylhydroperoxidase family enzyme